MHVCKREKKEKGRARGCIQRQAVCEGGVHGQGGAHSMALAKGAVRTVPPGQKPFHHHPGMARKAGHVLHTLSMDLCSRRDSRSLVQQGHPGWSLMGRAVTSRAINNPVLPCHARLQPSPVPTPLAEVSAFPCAPKDPTKRMRRFPWRAVHEHRGMSSPRAPVIPSARQVPGQMAV